jgi:hypothetical protein
MKTQLGLVAVAILFSAAAVSAQTSGMPSGSGSASASGNVGANSGTNTATGGMSTAKGSHHHRSKSASALPATSKSAKEAQPPGSGPTSGR